MTKRNLFNKKNFDVSRQKPERLNLSYKRSICLPVSDVCKIFAVCFFIFLLISSAQAPQIAVSTYAAEETSGNGLNAQEERQQLEQQLNDLEKQIIEHQQTIQEYQKKGNTLKNEINALNTKINQLNLQIKAVNLNLEKLNGEITETQTKINKTENNIDKHRDALSKSIRDINEADSQTLIEMLLANNNLSDFFGNINNITLVQSNLRTALTEFVKLREDLISQKQELAAEKNDVENLKAYRESQKKSVVTTQGQKDNLLKETKGKESEYQKLLVKTKETAAQIRSRIFQLLGGGELTFEKAYEFAKLAEGATGVRAAFILAILEHESLLGKNVGRCNYKTAMHPTRDIPIFLDLLKRLSIDPDSSIAQVSCPNQDGTYGGAMGPAQFIPSTWKLYENEIAKITKNNPPSPWNSADAFVATALYLKDSLNSSSCRNYSALIPGQEQMLKERCAAAQYYAGKRWYNYRFVYGDPVINKANKFQKDIDILNSST